MDFPEELRYSKEHVWVRIEGSVAVVGISDFAQEELGSISCVELPEAGDELEQDDAVGSFEGRKGISEFYTPLSGTVKEVNQEVIDNPDLLNDDPYDSGWLLEIEIADTDELKILMGSDDYLEYLESRD